jgi:hypothetical protein
MGLRRILTDIAPDYTDDDRALDRLTGHRDPTTRKRIYQDREREEAQEEAAIARRTMRSDLSYQLGVSLPGALGRYVSHATQSDLIQSSCVPLLNGSSEWMCQPRSSKRW